MLTSDLSSSPYRCKHFTNIFQTYRGLSSVFAPSSLLSFQEEMIDPVHFFYDAQQALLYNAISIDTLVLARNFNTVILAPINILSCTIYFIMLADLEHR